MTVLSFGNMEDRILERFSGYKNGYFRLRAGDGGQNESTPGSTSTMALLDVPHSVLQSRGYTDGLLHEFNWEMSVGDGSQLFLVK